MPFDWTDPETGQVFPTGKREAALSRHEAAAREIAEQEKLLCDLAEVEIVAILRKHFPDQDEDKEGIA